MQPVKYNLAFAAGATRAQIGIGNLAPIRLLVGTGWSSTATIVHVETSEDGATYYPLWASGTAYTLGVKAGRATVVDPTKFYGVSHIRLIGTLPRGTASPQSTACVVGIVAGSL